MSWPWYTLAVTATYGLPLVAIGMHWRSASRPQRLIAMHCGVAMLSGIAGFIWSWILRRGSNLAILSSAFPIEILLQVLAIAAWNPKWRRALLALAPTLAAAWIAASLWLEQPGRLPIYSVPGTSIPLLVAAVATLAMLALDERQPLKRQAWFWVLSGLAIEHASLAGVAIIADAYLPERADLALAAFDFRNAFSITAYVLIAVGLRLPDAPTRAAAARAA